MSNTLTTTFSSSLFSLSSPSPATTTNPHRPPFSSVLNLEYHHYHHRPNARSHNRRPRPDAKISPPPPPQPPSFPDLNTPISISNLSSRRLHHHRPHTLLQNTTSTILNKPKTRDGDDVGI